MIRNFLFHRVNPVREKLWDPMDVALFEKCIKYISQKYNVLLIEDLVLSDNLFSKNKSATITFDDGYKDNIEFAAPILAKYNCKASFYVVTDCIDLNMPPRTHILEYKLQFTGKSQIIMDFDYLPAELKTKNLKSTDERINYARRLIPYFKKLSRSERNEVFSRISETCNDTPLPDLMMNWNDLKELKSAGHYIGSHSVTHCMLGNLTDETEIKNELIQSGNKIKENLGYFPLTICYPSGSFNETTKRIAKEAGYKIGLAVKQNVFNPSKDDLYEISRIELYNESWWKTRMRITNSLEKIKSFINYK